MVRVRIGSSFLHRKESFGGIGYIKGTNYFSLTKTSLYILNYITKKQPVSSTEICKKFNINEETIQRWLSFKILEIAKNVKKECSS